MPLICRMADGGSSAKPALARLKSRAIRTSLAGDCRSRGLCATSFIAAVAPLARRAAKTPPNFPPPRYPVKRHSSDPRSCALAQAQYAASLSSWGGLVDRASDKVP